MLNTFWNATKIDAMTAMLSQRVLDAISIDMVVRAPKRGLAPAGCGAPPREPPFFSFQNECIYDASSNSVCVI